MAKSAVWLAWDVCVETSMIWGTSGISYVFHCRVEVATDDSWREGLPWWRHRELSS